MADITGLWKIIVNDSEDVVLTQENISMTWQKYFFIPKVLNVSDRIQIAIGFYIEFYWGQEKMGNIS